MNARKIGCLEEGKESRLRHIQTDITEKHPHSKAGSGYFG
jgi:hypothetical protein